MTSSPAKGKVMAFGTFDLLHSGHLHYLKEARALGKILCVVVARDATVESIKGNRPMNREEDRLDLVRALKIVDYARLGNEAGDILKVVEEEQPEILALGYDQFMGEKELQEKLAARGLRPVIQRISAFKSDVYKSSKLKDKLATQ